MEPNTAGAVRIIHCGNLFLDRPVARMRTDVPERRREELRDAFCNLISYVKQEGVQIVLISGNLFDNGFATNDTLEFLAQEFACCSDCHFVIAPGGADHFFRGSLYASGRLPDNVHVFSEEVLSRFDFDELGVTVYGWSFTGAEHRFSPLLRKRVADRHRLNLLLGTCRLDDPMGTECPVLHAELEHFGAHYAGFSGNSPHDGFFRLGDCVVAYSGSFESFDFEGGEGGGVNEILATPTEDGFVLQTRRRRTGVYRYATEYLDVSEQASREEIERRLRERVADRGYDEKTILRLILRGTVSPEVTLPMLRDPVGFGLYALQTEDHTVPTAGLEHLHREMSTRGELYRRFLPLLTEGTPEERAEAARTFRIAYAALAGDDVTVR